MANTVIDYARPAKVQFFELLNSMATEVLAEEDVTLGNPEAGAGDGNTSINVTINRLVIPNPKQLHYDRVSIADVFGLQDVICVREIDMGLVNDLPDIDGAFVDTFFAKYGFKIHAEDFNVNTINPYNVKVAVKGNNLGYTGNIDVVIEKSLATRIPNNVLNGFEPSQLVLS